MIYKNGLMFRYCPNCNVLVEKNKSCPDCGWENKYDFNVKQELQPG